MRRRKSKTDFTNGCTAIVSAICWFKWFCLTCVSRTHTHAPRTQTHSERAGELNLMLFFFCFFFDWSVEAWWIFKMTWIFIGLKRFRWRAAQSYSKFHFMLYKSITYIHRALCMRFVLTVLKLLYNYEFNVYHKCHLEFLITQIDFLISFCYIKHSIERESARARAQGNVIRRMKSKNWNRKTNRITRNTGGIQNKSGIM